MDEVVITAKDPHGPAQIPEDNGGSRVAQGYSWIVYAQDADRALIASSPQRDISP